MDDNSERSGTGERQTVGKVPEPRDAGTERAVTLQEAELIKTPPPRKT